MPPVRADRRARDPKHAPRVLLLALFFPPEYTGAGVQAERLSRALVAQGVPLEVLTTRPGPPPGDRFEEGSGLLVRRFRVPRWTAARKTRMARARELVLGVRAALHLLRRSDWDVLHVLDASYFSVLPCWVAHLRGRPVLVKTTLLRPARAAPPRRLLAWARRRGYETADAVVVLSDALESRLREGYRLRGRVLRIPNGVDVERFRPPEPGERRRARERRGLPEEAFVVVTCGTLAARKNATALVRAAGRMRTRPLAVVLAGPESPSARDREELERATAALPRDVQVLRTGALAADGIPEILHAADAYALPSRQEGLPNSLLEGMAAGLPCVATDIPGSRDVLRKGGGELVPLDDVDALARSLDRLAAEPEQRERLGREALDVVRRHYSLGAVAERYRHAYRALVEGGEPDGAASE